MRSKELENISNALPESSDPLFRPTLIAGKYWRYANRKDHPQYEKMNAFIGIALTKGFKCGSASAIKGTRE